MLTLNFSVKQSDKPYPWGDDGDAWAYTITAGANVVTITGDFYTGPGLRRDGEPVPPTLGAVLECLCLDAQAADEHGDDLAGFLWDFGYCGDEDSLRDGFRAHAGCVKVADDLRRLLGEHFDAVVYDGPEDGWSSLVGDTLTLTGDA